MPGVIRIVTVCPTGDLDGFTAAAFAAQLDDALRERPQVLNVDCADVTFVDSAGVAVMVSARRALRAWGGSLMLRHVPGQVRLLLDLHDEESQE